MSISNQSASDNPVSLTRLLSSLPGMVYRCPNDQAWSMDYVSSGSLALTGYHPQQLTKNQEVSYASLIHPEDRDRIWNAVQQALERHHPFQLVYRIRDVGGQEKWVWEQGQGVWTEHQLEALEGFVFDITAHKVLEAKQQEAAAELQMTQRFLQSVLENLPVAVIAKNATDFRFVLWNATATKLFRLSPEQVLGRTGFDVFPQAIAKARRQRDLQALRSDAIIHIPVEETQIEGKLRLLQTWQTRIVDVDGTPQYLLTIANDVTEREQLRETQRQAEERLRTYSQALGQLVRSKTRAQEDLHANLREITEVACRAMPVAIAGIWLFAEEGMVLRLTECYTQKTQEHSNGIDLVAADYPNYFKALASARLLAVVDACQDPRTHEFCTTYLKPQGITSLLDAPIWLSGEMIGVLCLEHEGEPRTWTMEEENFAASLADFVSLALETWNRQQAEAALRQKTEHLEAALNELQCTQTQLVQSEKMSSLGQLVAGVAHEINNPVNFIYGNLDPAQSYIDDLLELIRLYQKQYPEPGGVIAQHIDTIELDFVKEDLPRLLSSMRMGAERIQKIVKSLRNFSRTDESEIKAVDLLEGIESTLMILQNRLKRKADHPEIRLVKEYGPLPPVECYVGQINQVFMNLLSNAIDALEEKLTQCPPSEEQLWLPQIRIVTEQLQENWVTIRIADNGPGLTPSARQNLFQAFFTTKPLGKGTGLGLSISYQIVTEKHSGTLQCFSAPGEGVEFVIEIPVTQSRPA
ncbi:MULTISPECIES: ATP-binding protein [unclassified Leptolyngbya]|uniref:ATP-binding protein n=1 Tax=unclassified Leptolyngbya TaxID=2650499 RepID=UPI0016857FCB|nr:MULTISPECIES: ATP-binding protein [unclassified Leptolyngbya]MBD1912547.1 PAS domain-containing protein [Leptolyngbya sp. FACHB-8]MBD2154900.1 PAS domain-containing protein [Leptolyngbya sp. FACHB-16]